MQIKDDCIRQELRDSGINQEFDHWYINTASDLTNLEHFLDSNSKVS